ncbi:MAG: substrate-binding domain-containing protein [Turicibacter sp.]|nr:substrate-binding domain-containing protein [Turicibacter sp.]
MSRKLLVGVGTFLSLLLAACGAEEGGNSTQATTNTGRNEIVLNTDEILSTGPNGESAVGAYTLSLTDEQISQLQASNYRVAISFHYAGNDWSAAQLRGLEDTFERFGIEVVGITDANFSPETQVSDLEALMALQPHAIVSIPTDAVATSDVFRRVGAAGIHLVFMDNVPAGFTAGQDFVSVVSADNYGNGVIAADLIGEHLNGEGEVGVIFFDVDFFVTNQRLTAFENRLASEFPNIDIVARGGFADVNQVGEVADAMLTQNPNLEAIFAIWDIPAEHVLSSLTASGRTDVSIASIDLGNNIAREIASGRVLGVGAQLPYDQGIAEAYLVAYALLGLEAPGFVAVPALRVDQGNILSAYERVYHVPAPAWLEESLR